MRSAELKRTSDQPGTRRKEPHMKESQFRNKIYWFTFAFSILVVWVHAYNSELFLGRTEDGALIYAIEHGIGDTIAQIAVPGFFMISAYLFYRNFTWEKLWPKWYSRIRSILIPFIIWNTLYYLGYVTASRLPFLTDVVGKGVIPFGLMPAVDAILHYKYNYVFWYLYQLILLIALAPVIYPVLQRKYLGAVLMVLMAAGVYFGFAIPHLNLDALLYYSTGTYAALHLKSNVESWNKKTAWLGLLLLIGVTMYRFAPGIVGDSTMAIVLFRLLIPAALWMLVDEQKLLPAKTWMKYNFFLYATHFALVRLINKTAAMVLPTALCLPLVIYLLMPVLVLVISYPAGVFLRRYLPGVWRLLNGGR